MIIPVFFSMFLYVIVTGVIYPITTDDAWFFIVVKNYLDTHILLWPGVEAPVSFGKWYFYLISKAYVADLYFSTRIISIAASMASLIVIYKITKKIFNITSYGISAILLFSMYGISSGILVSSRPESFYIFCIILLLYFVLNYFETHNKYCIYYSAIVSSLSSSIHPNGLISNVIFGLFILVIYRKKIQKLHELLMPLAINIILISLLLIYDDTPARFLKGFMAIFNDKGHTLPFYLEYIRYKQFFYLYPYLAIPYLIGLIGLIRLYMNKKRNSNYNFFTVFYSSFLFIIFYLFILGAKWEYYIALQFPYLVIGAIFYFKSIRISLRYINALISGVLFLVFLRTLPMNEEFLSLTHIQSGRVGIISEVKAKTKNMRVLAPIQTSFLFQRSKYVPLEGLMYHSLKRKPAYLVLNILVKPDTFERTFASKALYLRSFVYNSGYYNLFEMKK